MNETFRAFLYGFLILAAALFTPLITMIDLVGKSGSS
jgi:hypothetical protein